MLPPFPDFAPPPRLRRLEVHRYVQALKPADEATHCLVFPFRAHATLVHLSAEAHLGCSVPELLIANRTSLASLRLVATFLQKPDDALKQCLNGTVFPALRSLDLTVDPSRWEELLPFIRTHSTQLTSLGVCVLAIAISAAALNMSDLRFPELRRMVAQGLWRCPPAEVLARCPRHDLWFFHRQRREETYLPLTDPLFAKPPPNWRPRGEAPPCRLDAYSGPHVPYVGEDL